MDASHEVGGVQNGSGGTGTSSWEHMQEKRVRDLKAAAEAKQRMEASITADIVSSKIKPKVKRNHQPKSAKQIDEDKDSLWLPISVPPSCTTCCLLLLATHVFLSDPCTTTTSAWKCCFYSILHTHIPPTLSLPSNQSAGVSGC
jgi:hypothetical protein